MEHSPNVQPMRRRERFDFEAFDNLIAEALGERVVAQEAQVIDLNANVVELFPDLPPTAA